MWREFSKLWPTVGENILAYHAKSGEYVKASVNGQFVVYGGGKYRFHQNNNTEFSHWLNLSDILPPNREEVKLFKDKNE